MLLVAVFAGAAMVFFSGGAQARPLIVGRTFSGPVPGVVDPQMWLRADAITGVVDGGSVATWPDSSGNGNAATQSTSSKQPVFKSGVVNGLPVVRFNGTSSVLTTPLSGAQKPVTVIALVNYATTMTTTGSIVGASANGGIQLQEGAPGNPANGGGAVVVNKQQIAPMVVGQSEIPTGAHIVSFTYDGTGEARLYLDGRLVASGRKDVTFLASQLWIGGNGSNNDYFSRDIGELLVYSSALADSDRAAVEASLRTKWATPAAPTATDPVLNANGLLEWHRADAIGTFPSGTSMSAWGDSSGMNATAMSGATSATYQNNVVAGLPTVRFAGGSSLITKVSGSLKPITLFALFYRRSMEDHGSIVGGSVGCCGTLQLQLTPFSNGRGVTVLNSENVTPIGVGKRSVPLGAHLLAATYGGDGSWQLFVDGEPVGSGINFQPAGGTLQLGAGRNGFDPLTGDIGEFVAYDNVLSTSDRQAVEAYLMQKWGVYDVPVGLTFGDCHSSSADVINPSGCQGDSNSATGAYTTSATDMSLAGIGVPFSLTRTYNSNDTSSGRLGSGWKDNLGASLEIDPNWIIYTSETGQQIDFMRDSSGALTPLGSSLVTLTAVSGGYELVRSDQTHLHFAGTGKLTSITDRNGQGLTLAYDGSGHLSSATDSGGRQVNFTSNTDGKLASLSVPGNRSVTYGYTAGLLTTVVDAAGKTWTYAYDSAGRLRTITDPNGHVSVTNTYGTDGRLTTQLDALNNQTTYSWDQAAQTQTMTDPRGNAWKDIYRDNVLVQRTDPLGNTTSYVYDGKTFDTLRTTDARGNVTTMTYDSRHNMLTKTAPAPLSYQETWTYNSFNDPLTYTDGRGNQTSFAYDTSGNLTSKSQPGSVVTTYTRDPAGTGLLTALIDPRGKTTTYGYDAAHNLTSITSALGEKTTMGYDSSGRLTSRVDPRGNVSGANPTDYTTSIVFDNLDRKTSQTDPLGNTTQWAYDPVGNLLSTTDANNHTTTYAYDAADRLSTVAAPGGATTTYVYDANSNLTQRTDPNNHVTSWSYDKANQHIGTTDPLNRSWSYTYDANGNKTQTTNPGNTTINDIYDAQNRLSSVAYSDSTPAVTYSYDANGNRTQLSDGAGSQSYSYDTLNRLTGVTRGSDSFGYSYDNASNLTSRTYPGGTQTTYTYDDDERLATATSGGQTTTYTYDVASNPISTTLPSGNGYVDTRTYDHAGRLTEIKNASGTSVLNQFDYQLDPIGKATQVTKAGGTVETYGYDNRGRLTSVCYQASCPIGSDPFIRWTYDPVGNRLTEARPTGTTTYSYDAGDQLTQAVAPSGTTTYSYDARGNQTQAGTQTYTYDLADRLKTDTSGSTTTNYAYDGDGNRLSATTSANTTNYLWDINNTLPQLALERDGSGVTLRTYIGGLDSIALLEGGNTYYYHHDRLGSITALTSSTGATEWAYSYEPFGTPLTTNQIDPGAPVNTLGYDGQYTDPTSNLVDLRARNYSPGTGLFLSEDPKPAGAPSPYEATYDYAAQDPINNSDPGGTTPCGPGVCKNKKGKGGAKKKSQPTVDKNSSTADIVGEILKYFNLPTPNGPVEVQNAKNEKGLVFREPGTTGNEDIIRIGQPNKQNPDGYMRIYNGDGDPIDPRTGLPGSNADTHIPPSYKGPFHGLPKWFTGGK